MISRGAVYTLINVLILSVYAAPAELSPDQRQKLATHVRQAQEYLRTNRTDLAAEEFRAIVALDPGNVDALGNLGVLLFFRGDYVGAIPHLRAALSAQPKLTKIQALLGMAEKRSGQFAPARTNLEQAWSGLQDEKVRVETGKDLLEIYYGRGELDKAVTVVSVLRQLRPADPDVLYSAYRLYSDLAGESLLGVAMLAPKSARMHQIMAHELARQRNPDAAIEHYREAMRLDPQLPGIHFELAEMLNSAPAAAHREEAEKEYRAAVAANPADAKAECRLGDLAARRADTRAAYEHYSRAFAVQPNDPEVTLGLGRTLLSMSEPEKAKPLLERTVQLDPTSAVARYQLATLYRQLGRVEDARRELAEFKKLKQLKDQLVQVYTDMKLEPVKRERDEPQQEGK